MADQQDGGAFWWATDRNTGEEKRTKNGDKYMTGKITIGGVSHGATLFYRKPDQKRNPKEPDISISINTQPGAQASSVAQGVADRAYPPAPPAEEPVRVEDIPF